MLSARHLLLAQALLQLVAPAVGDCSIADLQPDYEGISAVCCESTASPDCSQGFPVTCTRQCASLVAPFWADCSKVVLAFGDIFPSDETLFAEFADGPCSQTTTLYEHASLSQCAGPDLEAQIDEVNKACCEQDGVNMCGTGEAPWGCDAECESCHTYARQAGKSICPFVQTAKLQESVSNIPSKNSNTDFGRFCKQVDSHLFHFGRNVS
jgi:hypothetical protein